jgi:teichuronic acid biosynthesis glycosyltransferase TuaC
MNILYFTYSVPRPSSPLTSTFISNRIKRLIENEEIILNVISMEHIFRIHKYKKKYNFFNLGYNFEYEIKCFLKIENPYNYLDLLRYRNMNNIYKEYICNKSELLHAHFIRDGYYAYLLKLKYPEIKYVVTVHGSDITKIPYFSKRTMRITLDVLHNAEKIIFVSDYLRQEAISYGYNNMNSVIINNGYDPNLFYPDICKVCNKEIRIGYCGHLIARKNVMILPDVFKNIKSKYYDSELIIIGKGHLKNKLIKFFDKLGVIDSVIFIDSANQHRVAEEFRKIDVLLLPSHREGFPTVVAEAIGCELQVVGSNNGGIKEAIGECGHIVPFGTNFEKRFSEAVIDLIENPIEKLKFKERQISLHWKAIVEREIEIYKEVIRKYR